MPLIAPEAPSAAGLLSAETVVVQQGTPPANFAFPEQSITLGGSAALFASLSGEVRIDFDGEQTAGFAPNASATATRCAPSERPKSSWTRMGESSQLMPLACHIRKLPY